MLSIRRAQRLEFVEATDDDNFIEPEKCSALSAARFSTGVMSVKTGRRTIPTTLLSAHTVFSVGTKVRRLTLIPIHLTARYTA
jgi:hypothetical protein